MGLESHMEKKISNFRKLKRFQVGPDKVLLMLEESDCQQHDKNEKTEYEVNPIDRGKSKQV